MALSPYLLGRRRVPNNSRSSSFYGLLLPKGCCQAQKKQWISGSKIFGTLAGAFDFRRKLGGRGRTTIYRDAELGRLPKPVKIGSRLYWNEADVDATIQTIRA